MGLATTENWGTVIGSFVEKSAGKTHEYSLIGEESGAMGLRSRHPHKRWALDGFRHARILKTVAYIIVDEDEYGLPVEEKWYIKQHKIWEK